MKKGRELLIVGAGGMLGTALTRVASSQSRGFLALTEEQLDITARPAVEQVVAAFSAGLPDAGQDGMVINAAAYTDVDFVFDGVRLPPWQDGLARFLAEL